MHLAREDAIVQAVNRLLAEKGFDAMTVDEVAAEVGIAKASLYRHFPSKEDLAAEAMVRTLERAQAFLDTLDATLPPLQRLQDLFSQHLQCLCNQPRLLHMLVFLYVGSIRLGLYQGSPRSRG